MCDMATPTTPIQPEAPPPETPVTRARRPRIGGAVAGSLIGGLVAALLFVLLVDGPRRFTAPEAAAGRLIAVGGHRMYLQCTGSGSPTVVLASGLGERSPSWAWIAPAVGKTTRVCVYDRAGQGWSDDAAPQDGVQLAADLHTLLETAGERAPYVLAGHSVGGTYNLTFAARYPDQVAGMVLVDSASPK